jgi:hypothetical protein
MGMEDYIAVVDVPFARRKPTGKTQGRVLDAGGVNGKTVAEQETLIFESSTSTGLKPRARAEFRPSSRSHRRNHKASGMRTAS